MAERRTAHGTILGVNPYDRDAPLVFSPSLELWREGTGGDGGLSNLDQVAALEPDEMAAWLGLPLRVFDP